MHLVRYALYASSLCLLPLTSFSFTLQHEAIPVQFGAFFPSSGTAQDVNIQGLIGNHYTIKNKSSSNGLFGIGYYVSGLDTDKVHMSYGIDGYYFGTTTVTGFIVQEKLFTNLAYGYHIRNIPIYVAAKGIIKNNNSKYNVTFDAGIGPNFMRTSRYTESALNSFTIPANSFSSRDNVAFSVMAGVGARLNNVFGNAPLECGYRFFYLGQGHLNSNNNQILNNLKTGNNYANAVICSLSV